MLHRRRQFSKIDNWSKSIRVVSFIYFLSPRAIHLKFVLTDSNEIFRFCSKWIKDIEIFGIGLQQHCLNDNDCTCFLPY